MAAAQQAVFNNQAIGLPLPGVRQQQEQVTQPSPNRIQEEDIKKKALWLKKKFVEGPISGPSSLKTYREDIRQILFQEFNSPVTDSDISEVASKAFPSHSRKGKYYLGIGTANTNYADEAGRTITENLKSLMTIQSNGESRESSPVMLKPVKKRAIQAWKETENGQAFAADQMIRDANSQTSAPVVSVANNDGVVRPPWPPMFIRLPHPLHMPHRSMLFQPGTIPGTIPIPIPHAAMATSEPNNIINRSIPSSRGGRKRPGVNPDIFQKLNYGNERAGKKPRKDGAMIELSSHNGLIAERTNLAAMHIQPIILDFEVPPPKLPLPKPASESRLNDLGIRDETNASTKHSKSKDVLSNAAANTLNRVPMSPRAAESAEGPHSMDRDPYNKSLTLPSSDQDSKKVGDPFKKPDIDNYRTNVSAGRCLMCQNPIPPNGRDAPVSICAKCTKVAMSGSEALKPVPKFPFACNPKLAPKTVYVPPPRRLFRPRPPAPSGPQKAVGIRLYPPRSRSKSSSSQRTSSTPVQSPLALPSSPGQLSIPGSPAPSLPLGSPQPLSPAVISHSAPPSPMHASDAGLKMTSHSLPPSPSMISPLHLATRAASDTREPDALRSRPLPFASLQVPSPAYSSSPSTPGGRDSCSSERLFLPPGREQDDATIKALLQLGRGVDRVPSEHGTNSTPTPSPTNITDRDSTPHPYPSSSIPIPHSPVTLPLRAMSGSLPVQAGKVPMIPSNAGVVMGPEGQLLPIVPSWPFGVPTSEALSMISQGVYPPMPLFIHSPLSRESSSPLVSTPDPVISDIRSINPLIDPPKTSSVGPSPESHTYDISQLKHRKGYKKSRLADRMSNSPTRSISYGTEKTHGDKSKSKQSIVIVGTNCDGSSSIKLGNDGKEVSYHHHQKEVSRDAAEMYGKPFSAFCCRCSGREIILIQCTDCDFVCNNKFGMELHIAAQRHAESHNKSTVPEVITRHTNEADDRDEIASQSSVETQSADTDTDAASPPPTRDRREASWSRVSETSTQLPLTSWQDKVLQFIPPSRNIPQGMVTVRAPSVTSQASFITTSTYGSFGTVTENTVPLDLSGRTFQPRPFFPVISSSSFLTKEQNGDRSFEESSPLDLSGYNRSPVMSTMGNCSMQQFVSNQRLGTQGSMTATKTPLDLISSHHPLPIPTIMLPSLASKRTTQPPPPKTFFDLMRLHNMPIPTSAVTSTLNSSKSMQSPIQHSKLSFVHSSVGRTHFENPSSPKSYPVIPSIVLSSSTSTSSSVPKCSLPTTELTRPPPGIITAPVLSQPQFLNYQGGTISIRPTVPLTQTHVSSKTVPVLSPFPLSAPVLASASENRHSPGRESVMSRVSDTSGEYPSMDSLNVNVSSPNITLGSPSMGSLNFQESPKGRQRYSALESSREYSSRKDPSPVQSPQPLHIKIEPPDSLQEEFSEKTEQRWQDEAEKQARVLEASLNRTVHSSPHSPGFLGGRSGIGRTSWSITSKSLQIRDNSFVNTTTSYPAQMQLSPSTDLHNGPDGSSESSGVQGNDTSLVRQSSVPTCIATNPTTENHKEISREALRVETDNILSGHLASMKDRSTDSISPNTSQKDKGLDIYESGNKSGGVEIEPVSPTAWHIKEEK